MKFYTIKTLAKDCENITKEKELFKLRTIWKLASCDWKFKKVGVKRYEQAKKLYNAVRRCWRLKDLYLEADSSYSHSLAKFYSQKEDEQIEKIKKLCKPLGLVLICSTWAHIYADKNQSEIM